MAGNAAKVVISERQQEILRQLSTARTVAQYLVIRATLLLLAFQGASIGPLLPQTFIPQGIPPRVLNE